MVSIISIIFSKFAVGVKWTTSNLSYQTVVHLTPPTHYHAQCFEQYLNFESLTFADLQWPYFDPSQHDWALSKDLCTNSRTLSTISSKKFCEPFDRYIAWSKLTTGAPTTDLFSTPLFSRLIYNGDNDLWSFLPRVFSTFDFDLPIFRTEYHPHFLN